MRCPYLKIKTVKKIANQQTQIVETFGECVNTCPFFCPTKNGSHCKRIAKLYWIRKGEIRED